MRLMPRLAGGRAVRYSKEPSVAEHSCQAVSERRQTPISPTAPLLHLRELSCGGDNLRLLFSRRIELFEIGDDIVNLLGVLQARKSHFGTGYLGLRILDVFAESCFIPGNSGIFVRGGIAESLNRSSLSPEQPIEHRATCVLCFLPTLVTPLALDVDLFARSRLLCIAGRDCDASRSERQNQTAHPTAAM